MDRMILERDNELAELAKATREAATGHGCVVLVSGEAGIGKSSLLDAARGYLPAEGRILVGHCDDLATARTLGPFRDLIGSVGTELTQALRHGEDRDSILTSLLAELNWSGHPTLLSIEDVHWADDATLDVLRYLVRRVDELPAVLMLTYRDDEVGVDHPLRPVLGLAAASGRTRRLPLARLSPEAVRQLCVDHAVAADQVFAVTSGNPFFVREVLASGSGDGVPATVVDAVTARVRHLDRATRDAVEQLTIIPSSVERWLVEALLPGGLTRLLPAEQRGLLTVTPGLVTFRHELTRRAIRDTLPVARLTELNRRVLTALVDHGDADVARLVHHAVEAGDVAAIVRYAPEAARDAAGSGAHREAAKHCGRALEQRDSFSPAEQAGLLELSAIETYTTGEEGRNACADQEAVVGLRRTLGDPVALGESLRWLSRIRWWWGDRQGAEQAARQAVDALVNTDDAHALAMAYSNQAQLDMLADRNQSAVVIAERALTLARQAGDPAVLSHVLNNLGTAKWKIGDPGGRPLVEQSLEVALESGEIEHACRAYVNLGWNLIDELNPAEADRYLIDALELAERSEHWLFWQYMQAEHGMVELAGARWDRAEDASRNALEGPEPIRCAGLAVIARSAVRRGEPAQVLLEDLWTAATNLRELQRTGPAASVVAEYAWLHDDPATIRRVATPIFEEARRAGNVSAAAELGYWLVKAGQTVDLTGNEHPYALQAKGMVDEAIARWLAAGYRYEHAAAQTESDDLQTVFDGLAGLDAIGGTRLARVVRRRLRAQGVEKVPRGPAAATQRHPGGLTARQAEVLRLLGEGLTNADIADRLVLSPRTIDHHVSAVLEKLGVHSREQAAAWVADPARK